MHYSFEITDTIPRILDIWTDYEEKPSRTSNHLFKMLKCS